jgi:hypothetical protein
MVETVTAGSTVASAGDSGAGGDGDGAGAAGGTAATVSGSDGACATAARKPALNITISANRRNALDTPTPLRSRRHERAAKRKSMIAASDCGFGAASAMLLSAPTTLKIAQYDVNENSSY